MAGFCPYGVKHILSLKATALRQKENSEFMAEKTELEQAINAMERAIIVLGKGTKASAGTVGYRRTL